MMLGAKRAVLAPSADIFLGGFSGLTKAQPYVGIRTVGVYSHRNNPLIQTQRLD